MADLTREQIEEWRRKIKSKIFSEFIEDEDQTHSKRVQAGMDALCDMALRSLPSATAAPYGYAYICRDNNNGPIFLKHKTDWADSGSGLWTEIPLYAAPQAPRVEEGAINLEKANVDLATESALLRGLLSSLVQAVDNMHDLDEMDGPEFQEASDGLDAVLTVARPYTEQALLEKHGLSYMKRQRLCA